MQGGAVAPDTTQDQSAAAGKPSQEHMERATLRVREPQSWKRPWDGLLQTSHFTDEEQNGLLEVAGSLVTGPGLGPRFPDS